MSYMYCEVIDFFQILPSTKAAPNSSQSKIAMTRTSILLSSLTNTVSGCTLTNFCFSQIHLPAVSASEYHSIGRNMSSLMILMLHPWLIYRSASILLFDMPLVIEFFR